MTLNKEEKIKAISASLLTQINDDKLLLNYVQVLRQSLTQNKGELIDLVASLGLIEKLITFLVSPSQEIQSEAAWCLTNLAAYKSADCDIMRKLKCHETMVPLINSTNFDLAENVRYILLNFLVCMGSRQYCRGL